MDFKQVERHEAVELKASAVGSFNNLSETGSGCIPAEEGRQGSWEMMSTINSVSVVSCSSGSIEICNFEKLDRKALKMVGAIVDGFRSGVAPKRAEEGFGGTYMTADGEGNMVAIFKPCDEEPLAPCNPKGFVGRSLGDPGLKPTIRVGEAALREVAAYLLDRHRFANVPTTLLMRAGHSVFNYVEGSDDGLPTKLGSIQEFVSHLCDTTEMGTSKFTTSDVQRIGILDIRLYNTDRHAGNILVQKLEGASVEPFKETGYALVPIDHGFCLPEALEPPYFEWQHWSQARMPLGKDELEYIAGIDIESDKTMLRKELPVLKEASLRTMEVSTTVLKKCAAAGLSLHEIAGIMTRPFVGMDEEKSDLEKLCLETKEHILSVAASEISWHWCDGDSEDSESNATTTATPRIDELQFCIDDFKDLDVAVNAQEDTMTALIERISMEELECEGRCHIEPTCHIGMKNGHRSMSMALPSSIMKRGFVGQRTRRGHPSSAESPQKGNEKVAYPPLVHGAALGSADDVFRHMNEEEWRLFMEILGRKIEEGIKQGKWVSHDVKKRSMSMNLGISCPRF